MARSGPTVQNETGLELKRMLKHSSQSENSGNYAFSEGYYQIVSSKKGCPSLLWRYPPQAYWQIINGSK